MSLAGQKNQMIFILNFHLCLPKKNEGKPCQRSSETSPDLLFTCLLVMEFRFDAMLCANLGTENSDAGHIKNIHAGRVYSAGGRFPAFRSS